MLRHHGVALFVEVIGQFLHLFVEVLLVLLLGYQDQVHVSNVVHELLQHGDIRFLVLHPLPVFQDCSSELLVVALF